jgi:crotonobetainyl-CoA:carnitine CoA-transferase CaiB-like acyl-CoA transferase
VPAGRVLSVPQILAHAHTTEGGAMASYADVPGAPRPVRVTRPGFRINGLRPEASSRPPTLAEHRDRLLTELGYDAAARARLVAAGGVA